MPYWLESDTFADDEVWGYMANRKPDLEDRLQAAYCRLKAKAAQVMSNGYLSEQKALLACRGRRAVLELLCTVVVEDRPAMVHKRGDECGCLGDEWLDPYEYRIHAFLKRNPSRAENERNKAQKADLTDARLNALVNDRDGWCCRYCRSGPLSPKTNNRTKDRRKILHHDHVDPDKPAGPDGEGYVVACARCNEYKGHRLPHEADMVLLAPPTAAERVEWAARGQALFDREDWGPEYADIIGASSVASSPDHPDTNDSTTDRPPDRTHDVTDEHMGDVRPETAAQTSDQPLVQPGKGVGPGRGAGPPDRAPDTPPRKPALTQPVRSSADPDIYTRRSRAPSPEPAPVAVYEGVRKYVINGPTDEERPPWT